MMRAPSSFPSPEKGTRGAQLFCSTSHCMLPESGQQAKLPISPLSASDLGPHRRLFILRQRYGRLVLSSHHLLAPPIFRRGRPRAIHCVAPPRSGQVSNRLFAFGVNNAAQPRCPTSPEGAVLFDMWARRLVLPCRSRDRPGGRRAERLRGPDSSLTFFRRSTGQWMGNLFIAGRGCPQCEGQECAWRAAQLPVGRRLDVSLRQRDNGRTAGQSPGPDSRLGSSKLGPV